MNILLILVVLLLLFGGGGFYFGGPAIGGGGLGLILLICLIIYAMGGFRTKTNSMGTNTKGTQFMKKTIRLRWIPWLLSTNAAVVVLFSGCASPPQHSFNGDFNEALPTQPMYYIYDEDARHFRINVHQGTPSNGAERVIDVKDAASTIAKAESQKRGWEKWQLNYIQERNRGWMRIVVAEVTHE